MAKNDFDRKLPSRRRECGPKRNMYGEKALSDVHNKAKSIQIGSLNHFSFSSHYYLFTHFLWALFLFGLCISIRIER